MPGRKPKPTVMKMLHGNPGKRPINKKEPKFKGAPICPSWLPIEAKIEWKRIWVQVKDIELLKAVDQQVLAAYCMSFARWRSAEETVTKEGQTVREYDITKDGTIVRHPLTMEPIYKTKRHPATIIAKDEKMAMSKLASLMGFDPSSRSRIQAGDSQGEKPPHEETSDDYLFGSAPAVNSIH